MITSISGGSFTAAYYGLFGERIFSDYRARFLDRNIQGDLARRTFLNPLNWFRLASGNYSRIDIASKLYHDTVFERKSFGAMHARSNPPLTSINATNLANGKLFQFTQEQFDLLGSDLAAFGRRSLRPLTVVHPPSKACATAFAAKGTTPQNVKRTHQIAT